MAAETPVRGILAICVIGYTAAMFAIAWWSRRRIQSEEDFLVAGRRLPLLLAGPTLLATWFGAGTLLTATDEVRARGLRMAALDPIGAGVCLLLAGWLLARPLYRMRLLTLPDFYRNRFGARAERWASILMVPTYFGWIAAQFVALAAMLELFFGIDRTWGIALVAFVGGGYTLLGGMWSVTLTDAIQLALLAVGLGALAVTVLAALGDGSVLQGLAAVAERTPAAKLELVPVEHAEAFLGWLGVLCIGALGNLPGQDLFQRVFASRDERTAVGACHLAGIAYLTLGVLPLVLGLAADLLVPGEGERSTLPLLASLFLSPWTAIVFTLAVMSAVLSTIDSAILSPSSVIAHNLLPRRLHDRIGSLNLHRIAVLGVTLAALGTAHLGESAYEMLEDAYALGLVSLLVPLLLGVRTRWGHEDAALTAMTVGTGAWLVHAIADWPCFAAPLLEPVLPLPVALCCALLALAAYGLVARTRRSSVHTSRAVE
jgi:solute:Na+ symporter, SSS family